MKKYIVLALVAIVLTAYGGLTSGSLVKEKNSVSYSIQANDMAKVSSGYVVADLPQARIREVSLQDLRKTVYGPEVWLTQRRFNWLHRSDRLRLNQESMTAYKPISKEFCMTGMYSPPKIC